MHGGVLRTLVVASCALALAACLPPFHPFRRPDARLAEWERVAEQVRELAFTRSVELRWIRSAEIPELTRRELEERLPPDYIEAYRDAYAALGVFPPEADLLAELLRLQGDQLVGLYTPRNGTLYVLERPGPIPGGTEMVVVHELVHALQHQHFPALMGLLEGLRQNDDVVAAVAAAIEGDASFSALAVDDGDGFERSVAGAASVRDAFLGDLAAPTGVMGEVPRLLGVSLIFPYAFGVTLAAERYRDSGNEGLDALLREPPLSSLRVRWSDDREPVEFVRLPLAALAPRLAERGCRLGLGNVAGLITTDVLFDEHAGPENRDDLLQRWSGDRFQHVVCVDGWELLWLTRWDDPEAAADFARRYAEIADSVAATGQLAGSPRVVQEGRSALVVTPGLADLASLVLASSEIRAYQRLTDWLRDDCFPESPCPIPR